jgi:hypothetical protein
MAAGAFSFSVRGPASRFNQTTNIVFTVSDCLSYNFVSKTPMMRERRKSQRRSVFVDGTITFGSRSRVRCLIENVSEGGAKLVFGMPTKLPAEFTLSLPFLDQELYARTRWRKHRACGVEFVQKTTADAVSARRGAVLSLAA